MQVIAKKLDKVTLKFELQAGEEDKLFGSVTSAMMADEILAQGYKIDKKEIILEEPIKLIGNYFIEIKLSSDCMARIKVKVSAEI